MRGCPLFCCRFLCFSFLTSNPFHLNLCFEACILLEASLHCHRNLEHQERPIVTLKTRKRSESSMKMSGTISPQPSSDAKHKKKVEVKVHIAEATSTPEHTYVERIHTPKRCSSVKSDASETEWAELRHAHIDEDAASPSGLVDRVPTPVAMSSDRGFSSTQDLIQNDLDEEEQMYAEFDRRRRRDCLISLGVGLVAGCCATVAFGRLLRHRK